MWIIGNKLDPISCYHMPMGSSLTVHEIHIFAQQNDKSLM